MSASDRYWFKINKRNLFALSISLPLSIIIPATAFVFPVIILFRLCAAFIGANQFSHTHEDSIRFISSMPFSRKQIADTYIKGLLYSAAGYIVAVSTIRLFLLSINFTWVVLWSNPITSVFDYAVYIALFIFSMVFACGSNINSLNRYDDNRVSYALVAVFIISPALYVIQYVKAILIFIIEFTIWLLIPIGTEKTYVWGDSFNIISENFKNKIGIPIVVILIGIIIASMFWLIRFTKWQHTEFVEKRVVH